MKAFSAAFLNFFMKYGQIFIAIALSSCLTSSIALGQKQIYIAINNSECINCLGQIRELEHLDTGYHKVLVFQERYHVDSDVVWQRLHISDTSVQTIWSDSLYDRLHNKGAGFESTVSLINEETGKAYKTILANLSDNLDFYNKLLQDTAEFAFDVRPLGADVSFNTTGNYWYFFDNMRKEMKVYDRASCQHLYDLQMNDSLAQLAFKKRFGDKWLKEWNHANYIYEKRRVIDANVYTSFDVSNDTCYLLANHKFITASGVTGMQDSIVTVFLTLSIYKGGKLVDFSLVENYIGPEMTGEKHGIRRNDLEAKYQDPYYILNGRMLFFEGKLYLSLLGSLAPGKHNYFLARYKKDKQQVWAFDQFYERELPAVYLNRLGYSLMWPGGECAFYPPYFSLFHSDSLFSLSAARPDLGLHIFEKEDGMPSKGVWDLKVGEGYVCVVIMDKSRAAYCYLKYNIKTKETEVYQQICKYKESSFITTPKIDEMDFDYVFIPQSYDRIVRVKMGN